MQIMVSILGPRLGALLETPLQNGALGCSPLDFSGFQVSSRSSQPGAGRHPLSRSKSLFQQLLNDTWFFFFPPLLCSLCVYLSDVAHTWHCPLAYRGESETYIKNNPESAEHNVRPRNVGDPAG